MLITHNSNLLRHSSGVLDFGLGERENVASGNDKGRGLSDALRQANVYSFNGVLMLG